MRAKGQKGVNQHHHREWGGTVPVDEEFHHVSGRQTAGERVVTDGGARSSEKVTAAEGKAMRNPGKHRRANGWLLTH